MPGHIGLRSVVHFFGFQSELLIVNVISLTSTKWGLTKTILGFILFKIYFAEEVH